jgi:CHAT domain-containing protein
MRSFNQESDGDRITWEQQAGDAYRNLVELRLLHQKDPAAALRVWEWYRAAPSRRDTISVESGKKTNDTFRSVQIPFRALEAGAPRPIIKEMDATVFLPIHEAKVITYAWLTNGLAIWISDGMEIHSEWSALDKEVFRQVAERFVDDCADPSSDVSVIRADGQQLYRWLFAPIEPYLRPGQLLLIESDKNVGLIPFQAIADSSGHYLGERWTFLYSPGILYRETRPTPRKPLGELHGVIVGISRVSGTLAEGLPSLPDAVVEAETIAGRFRSRTLLLDNGATFEAVENALAGAETFHFAGHALVAAQHPGLLLTGSSNERTGDVHEAILFGIKEIRKMHLTKCQLVVLSACSTAKSEDFSFDPEDLVGAFLRDGARNVVASRWNVDSSTTRIFMNSFYAGLGTKQSVPLALQTAASAMRGNAMTSHPYFWAAFSGYGAN